MRLAAGAAGWGDAHALVGLGMAPTSEEIGQGDPPFEEGHGVAGVAGVQLLGSWTLHHRGLATEVARGQKPAVSHREETALHPGEGAKASPLEPQTGTGTRSSTTDVPKVLRAHALPTDVGGAQHEAEAARTLESPAELAVGGVPGLAGPPGAAEFHVAFHGEANEVEAVGMLKVEVAPGPIKVRPVV